MVEGIPREKLNEILSKLVKIDNEIMTFIREITQINPRLALSVYMSLITKLVERLGPYKELGLVLIFDAAKVDPLEFIRLFKAEHPDIYGMPDHLKGYS